MGALTIDHSGGRLISGGRDHQLYFWDFHLMDQRLRHLKTMEPIEGNPVIFLILISSDYRSPVWTHERQVSHGDAGTLCAAVFARRKRIGQVYKGRSVY